MSKREQVIPRIDYEEYIAARAREFAAEFEPFDDPEREAQRRASLLEAERDQFKKWTALGNLYADVLEDSRTSSNLHTAILEELDELGEAAGGTLVTTEPAVIRMLYPWLRDLKVERETLPPVETDEPEDDKAETGTDETETELPRQSASTSELAAHLAAVMAHPETPARLYNAMVDQLNSMVSDIDFYTPDMIEQMLAAFKRQESQEEGGAS